MSIRVRLVISYIAMVAIPFVLSIIAAIVIFGLLIGKTQKNDLNPEYFSQIPQKVIKAYIQIDELATSDPDKLMDKTTLETIALKLRDANIGLVVKNGNDIAFISTKADNNQISSRLSDFKSAGKESYNELKLDKKSYTVFQRDFYFKDGRPGSVYLIADFGFIGDFVSRYFGLLARVIFVILILTNGLITYFVSKSIIKPLKLLKYGTQQIKEGNLDFVMECKSRDEIGEVCYAFEEMRGKLKESIDLQLQYEENRKELISSISHDLKTPITSIKGYVEGIIDGVAETPEKVDKYIKTIYSKAIDMDRLIDDLFLFSKLDLKKLPFNFEKVDIKEYFEDSKDELIFDLEKNGFRLHLIQEVDDGQMVLLDRDKIKRVIMNIVENAVKYMGKENGEIYICVKDSIEFINVEIRDNGLGISKEDLPFVFERFYRADISRNTSTGGSGLGLAIAKQIIEGHGGKISIQSEINVGTSIFFSLKKV